MAESAPSHLRVPSETPLNLETPLNSVPQDSAWISMGRLDGKELGAIPGGLMKSRAEGREYSKQWICSTCRKRMLPDYRCNPGTSPWPGAVYVTRFNSRVQSMENISGLTLPDAVMTSYAPLSTREIIIATCTKAAAPWHRKANDPGLPIQPCPPHMPIPSVRSRVQTLVSPPLKP